MCQGLGPKTHDDISEIDRTRAARAPFSPGLQPLLQQEAPDSNNDDNNNDNNTYHYYYINNNTITT